MMGVILSALLLQTTPHSGGTNLVCQKDGGGEFSVFIPANPMVDQPEQNTGARYRVTGIGDETTPSSVIGSLADSLSIIWQTEDGSEVLLDLIRYNPANGTARYRMRRESDPSAAIVTVTSSDGHCVRRSTNTQIEGSIAQ